MLKRNDAKLGDNMRAARKEKGWTIEEFAKKIKVHKVMPGRYELGKTKPSRLTLERINVALFGSDYKKTIDSNAPSCMEEIKELKDFSIEEIINELKNRGAVKVDISFS